MVIRRRRALFRLVSEAKRISLAHLFDPFLAVQTSPLEPLPDQIDAVYSQMLPRQPLRRGRRFMAVGKLVFKKGRSALCS